MDAESRDARGAFTDDVLQEDVRGTLRTAAEDLARWRERLEELVEQLPRGEYAAGTDEPLDLPAAWRGLIGLRRRVRAFGFAETLLISLN